MLGMEKVGVQVLAEYLSAGGGGALGGNLVRVG